jgi:hypothetical protein
MIELPGLPEDEETQRAEMRRIRDAMLAASDFTQAADDPTGNAAGWAEYRQALRDAPNTWTPGPTWTPPPTP